MSGVPRWSPTTLFTPAWNAGRLKIWDEPPPATTPPGNSRSLSLPTTSGAVRLPLSSIVGNVPPIEVSSGSDDGQVLVGIG